MGHTFHDLKHAARMLRKQPAFTLLVVLTLALGIGANTVIFSVVNSILFRPLPLHEPDRLAVVWMTNSRINVMEDWHSYPNFAAFRDTSTTFADVAGYNNMAGVITGDGEPARVIGAHASHNFLPLLGIRPLHGRTFTEEEDREGASPVIVISHGLWQRHFGSDPAAVGKKITMSGRIFEIIGVMPPGFAFPQRTTEFWIPMSPTEQLRSNRNDIWVQVLGRMKPSTTRDLAQQDLAAVMSRLATEFPDSNDGYGVNVVPLHQQTVGRIRPHLLVLLAAVGAVLLIACANVANLLLVRASGREREIAIRSALGAGRLRIVRQLLTESTLLAVVGGALGAGLAVFGLEALLAISPADTPRLDGIAIDSRALLFTAAVTLLTGFLFGLAPALTAARSALGASLKEGGRGASGGTRVGRLRSTLVVAEIAVSLVLLISAGLLIRSFINLQRTDLGFNPENLLTLRLQLSGDRYREGPASAAFYAELENRAARLPGTQSVGAASTIFLSQTPNSSNFTIDGRPDPPPSERVEVPIDIATPDFFRSMGIRLISGRTFTPADAPQSPRVVLINETFARRFFPNENPVGKRLKFGGAQSRDPWKEIVGVIADTRRTGFDYEVRPETWLPHAQTPARGMTLVLRTTGDRTQTLSSLRAEVRSLDSNIPVFDVRTMDELLGGLLAQRRLTLVLMAVFSAVALILAAVGIYGVLAYSVGQRTREIGVRMALGAQSGAVLSLILRQGLTLALLGVAIGLAVAFAATTFLSTLLYGVSRTDVATFLIVPILLLSVAALACWLPARRAARTDPIVALRYE